MAHHDANIISIRELYSRSHAIVIGISNYVDKSLWLKNPVNDAKEMARVLKEKYAFDDVELILDRDATRQKLAEVFDDKIRGKDITEDDRLLVYYAGHGEVRQSTDQQGRQYEESFIVPADAKVGFYSTYLNLDTATYNCQRCKAKHVLLILDSCFSGTAFLAGRSLVPPDNITDEYLRRITTKRSLQAIAATDKNQRALDSGLGSYGPSSEHGAFTSCLLEILNGEADQDNDGILTASEVGSYLMKNVPRSKIPQNPLFGYLPGSEVGDFIFNVYNLSNSTTVLSQDEVAPLSKEASDHYMKKDYDKAIILYDRILAVNPKHIASLIRKGISCMKLERFEEARACFNRVLDVEADNLEAIDYIERLEQLVRQPIKVVKKRKESAKISNIDARNNDLLEKGNGLFFKRRYKQAIECYDKAIEISPEDAILWNNKGLSLHNLHKYSEAITCYNKAIKLKPEFDDSWNNKGLSLHNLHKYSEAITCYNKAIKLKADDAIVWNNKGRALHNLHKYSEAITCYNKAIKLKPKQALFYTNKGSSLEEMGETEEANKCFRLAKRLA